MHSNYGCAVLLALLSVLTAWPVDERPRRTAPAAGRRNSAANGRTTPAAVRNASTAAMGPPARPNPPSTGLTQTAGQQQAAGSTRSTGPTARAPLRPSTPAQRPDTSTGSTQTPGPNRPATLGPAALIRGGARLPPGFGEEFGRPSTATAVGGVPMRRSTSSIGVEPSNLSGSQQFIETARRLGVLPGRPAGDPAATAQRGTNNRVRRASLSLQTALVAEEPEPQDGHPPDDFIAFPYLVPPTIPSPLGIVIPFRSDRPHDMLALNALEVHNRIYVTDDAPPLAGTDPATADCLHISDYIAAVHAIVGLDGGNRIVIRCPGMNGGAISSSVPIGQGTRDAIRLLCRFVNDFRRRAFDHVEADGRAWPTTTDTIGYVEATVAETLLALTDAIPEHGRFADGMPVTVGDIYQRHQQIQYVLPAHLDGFPRFRLRVCLIRRTPDRSIYFQLVPNGARQ